jgi:hypothetical protein
MNISVTSSCCGVRDICELREHETAKEAMQAFVQNSFSECGNYIGATCYLFDGVKRFTPDDIPPPPPKIEDYRSEYWNTERRMEMFRRDMRYHQKLRAFGYAGRFARYIRAHNLGQVVSCRPQRHGQHPTHIIEAYLWTPSIPKLTALWNKYKDLPYISVDVED